MRHLFVGLILLLAIPAITFSQTITIRGQVKAKSGPVAGAAIFLEGSSTGTATDTAGKFSITIRKLPATISVSAVGYAKKLIQIKSEDSIKFYTIALEPDLARLEEVVVVGYTMEKRRSLTVALRGAIAPGIRVESPRSPSNIYRSGKPVKVNPGSKVLTAGELSDFKKWKLWGDYTKAEFQEHSEHWGIKPIKRYCLQVQNKEGRAIAGEKAYLIRRWTNDTAWTAVTDNTGKAELWAGIKSEDNEQSEYIIVCSNQTHYNPRVFEHGINRITINKPCFATSSVDIAFVVDATGSMGDEIKYLQEELQDVIANIAARNQDLHLRTGSVFYRDHSDEYVTRVQDFGSDVSSLINFIKKQHAAGGGDFPEAVDDALDAALNKMQWDKNAQAKILFLVLDAPPHDHAKKRMKALVVQAAAMGVRIVPVVCSGINKSTEYLMRSIALATNGSYVFLTDDSGVGEKHIKPTSDNFKVELLNDLLQRLIAEMIYTESCNNVVKKNFDNEEEKDAPTLITAFPNPTAGIVQIKSSEKIKELYVADFTGKILERIYTGNKNLSYQADLSKYPSGTYLVSYFVKDKGWGSKRIVLTN
jgi:hypothetical protein